MAYPLWVWFRQRVGSASCLMPKNLKRIIGRGDLHFITFCCYQRRALLGTVRARNLAAKLLGEVRNKYGFALVGYVLMPEHVHLLISESPGLAPAKIIQVFKQRLSRKMRGKKRRDTGQLCLCFPWEKTELRRFWQRRGFPPAAQFASELNFKAACCESLDATLPKKERIDP